MENSTSIYPRLALIPVARVARIRQLDEKDLLSFAIITTDPPPEISEAGHDRCQVPIKSEDLDAWLNPDPNNVEAMDKILADNAMPHFTHSVAG